jgi:hypothetical protein
MAEAFYNATEGSGKKLHMNSRTIGADLQHDEFVVPGEFPYPSYDALAQGISTATAADHLLTLNAGASLNVRIRRIEVRQQANATAASINSIQVLRTTTAAPTGGAAVTPSPYDTTDAASGAAARTLPTAKGTEAAVLYLIPWTFRQTVATAGDQADNVWEWYQKPGMKPIIIPAGTTNGIAIKNVAAVAGATMTITIEFVETNFV